MDETCVWNYTLHAFLILLYLFITVRFCLRFRRCAKDWRCVKSVKSVHQKNISFINRTTSLFLELIVDAFRWRKSIVETNLTTWWRVWHEKLFNIDNNQSQRTREIKCPTLTKDKCCQTINLQLQLSELTAWQVWRNMFHSKDLPICRLVSTYPLVLECFLREPKPGKNKDFRDTSANALFAKPHRQSLTMVLPGSQAALHCLMRAKAWGDPGKHSRGGGGREVVGGRRGGGDVARGPRKRSRDGLQRSFDKVCRRKITYSRSRTERDIDFIAEVMSEKIWEKLKQIIERKATLETSRFGN